MTDRPIIFSAPMVRALLEGRKTMTRRLAWRYREIVNHEDQEGLLRIASPWQRVQPGDRLWVREAFAEIPMRELFSGQPSTHLAYRAGHSVIRDYGLPSQATALTDDIFADAATKWRSPIHMPRRLSRLTLTVTAKKIERLQAISEADARAEGVPRDTQPCDHSRQSCEDIGCLGPTHRCSFAELWMALHGADAWDANPEVVALTFTVALRNIDSPEARTDG